MGEAKRRPGHQHPRAEIERVRCEDCGLVQRNDTGRVDEWLKGGRCACGSEFARYAAIDHVRIMDAAGRTIRTETAEEFRASHGEPIKRRVGYKFGPTRPR